MTSRLSWPAAAELALTATIAAAAGASFQRVFGLAPLIPVLAAAAILPAVLSAFLFSQRRWLPAWAAFPVSMVAWLIVASAALLHGADLAALRTSLSDGWWQMLTTILPAPASGRLLLDVHLLVWLASMTAAEIVLRTRMTLLAVLPGLGVLLAGLALGVDGPGSDRWPAVALMACAGLFLVLRTAGQPRVLPGAALVAVVAVIAAVAEPWLAPARAPFDLRRFVHPAADQHVLTSPLDDVSLWLTHPQRPLFQAVTSVPRDWRLAVLDTFDGQTWSASGTFISTGGRIPPGPDAATASSVTQTVTIQDLGGGWLPAVGQPTAVTGAPIDVDPATGVLLDRASLTAGTRYRAVSRVAQPDFAELRAAAVADDAAARASLMLPAGAPAVIARTAQAATAGAAFPLQQAVLLQKYLYTHEEFDPAAAPGHSYGAVSYFLATSHRGTSEQFATAYALLARALGLPSRVVVGFRPGQQVAPDTWQVRGTDVLVWPEVDFARLGWMAFFPTPAVAGLHPADGVPAGQSAAEHSLDQRIGATRPAPARAVPGPVVPRSARGPAQASQWPLIAVIAATTAAAGYLTCVVLAIPASRRRTRQRGDPATRVAGAWAETLDCLRILGVPSSAAHSAPEVAAEGGGRLRPPAQPELWQLAVLSDRACFAPVPPDDAAARQAWRHCDTIRRETRALTTRRARVASRLRPRSSLTRFLPSW